jgi:membrane-bound lytic murein transglycosylase D
MRIPGCLFFVAIVHLAAAQGPQVPHKMQFADLTLTIRDDARREIQKDVDALTQSPRHFNIKVERAKTYFPLIEKVFKEENVPDDFKFLVLQESALIADAVSVSNAVGFWQFKDFTAVEMGLRVDKEIDERLNIVSSSRAAARYIKKNNTFFNNWIFALQAYQMGAGGVMRSVKDSKSGAQHMEITSNTYWYVKKYLAHKVAFEEAVKGVGLIQVIAYENQKQKTLSDLAKEVTIDEASLKSYNKWTKSGHIPDDRKYAVLIPVTSDKPLALPEDVIASNRVPVADIKTGEAKSSAAASKKLEKKKINGILIIQANDGDNPTKLAARAGVDLSMFLKWNDMTISDNTPDGRYYLLGKKRNRAEEAYHKVTAGETLWSISQQYGVQIKRLRRYNKIDSDADLKPGMTLWLNATKPKNSDKVASPTNVLEINREETFAWTPEPSVQSQVVPQVDSAKSPAAAVATPATIDTAGVKSSVPSAPGQEAADSTKILQVTNENIFKIDSVAAPLIQVVVPEKKDEHIVQPKETLYGIAKHYNVGVMDLVKWNNLNLQEGIKPGQVLKLSDVQPVANDVPTAVSTAPAEHEVKPTDTLYSIARKYNVTIQELMEWNNKKNFSLTVGEKLKVKSK